MAAAQFTKPFRDEHTGVHLDRAVIMTIDCQGDWIDPEQPYGIPAASAVVPALSQLLETAREAGTPIVHVVRIYTGDKDNADRCRRTLLGGGTRHCAPGDPGTELIEALRPEGYASLDCSALLVGQVQQIGPDEVVVYKPRFGAFSQPHLDDYLMSRQIDSVIVCGISFPRCVISTLLGAIDLDLRVGLVTDATSEVIDEQLAYLSGVGIEQFEVSELAGMMQGAASRR